MSLARSVVRIYIVFLIAFLPTHSRQQAGSCDHSQHHVPRVLCMDHCLTEMLKLTKHGCGAEQRISYEALSNLQFVQKPVEAFLFCHLPNNESMQEIYEVS